MKMNIVKINDVDFEYIGLAFFSINQKVELESFYNTINSKLNTVVIEYSGSSLFEVGIIFRTETYFSIK